MGGAIGCDYFRGEGQPIRTRSVSEDHYTESALSSWRSLALRVRIE